MVERRSYLRLIYPYALFGGILICLLGVGVPVMDAVWPAAVEPRLLLVKLSWVAASLSALVYSLISLRYLLKSGGLDCTLYILLALLCLLPGLSVLFGMLPAIDCHAP
jgi:hypothetical protein